MITLALSLALTAAALPPLDTTALATRCEKLASGRSVCMISEEDLDKLIASNDSAVRRLREHLESKTCRMQEAALVKD